MIKVKKSIFYLFLFSLSINLSSMSKSTNQNKAAVDSEEKMILNQNKLLSWVNKNRKYIIPTIAAIIMVGGIAAYKTIQNQTKKSKIKNLITLPTRKAELEFKEDYYKRQTPLYLKEELSRLNRARKNEEKVGKFITVKDLKQSIAKALKQKGYRFNNENRKWINTNTNKAL